MTIYTVQSFLNLIFNHFYLRNLTNNLTGTTAMELESLGIIGAQLRIP